MRMLAAPRHNRYPACEAAAKADRSVLWQRRAQAVAADVKQRAGGVCIKDRGWYAKGRGPRQGAARQA